MKQQASKEKFINSPETNRVTAQAGASNTDTGDKEKKEGGKKPVLTMDDLKGKKVDGDPSLKSDQPIDQLYPTK